MGLLRLLLLRHAEAEEAHGGTDRGRTLTRRGAQQAASLAKMLAAEGFAPGLIVTSNAARTLETTAALVKALAPATEPVVDKRLYLGGMKDIQTVVGELATDATSLVVVGHNPGWSLAAQALCDVTLELATAEGAELTVEADDWTSALALTGAWELVRVLRG